ncbi:hypothetical protein [Bacillus coreaensis]
MKNAAIITAIITGVISGAIGTLVAEFVTKGTVPFEWFYSKHEEFKLTIPSLVVGGIIFLITFTVISFYIKRKDNVVHYNQSYGHQPIEFIHLGVRWLFQPNYEWGGYNSNPEPCCFDEKCFGELKWEEPYYIPPGIRANVDSDNDETELRKGYRCTNCKKKVILDEYRNESNVIEEVLREIKRQDRINSLNVN